MSFMRPEVTQEAFHVGDAGGETYVAPAYVWGSHERFAEETGCDPASVETVDGKWWARLSAPGYLDCTDWTGPHDSADEARAALDEMFGTDDDDDDDDDTAPTREIHCRNMNGERIPHRVNPGPQVPCARCGSHRFGADFESDRVDAPCRECREGRCIVELPLFVVVTYQGDTYADTASEPDGTDPQIQLELDVQDIADRLAQISDDTVTYWTVRATDAGAARLMPRPATTRCMYVAPVDDDE